MAVYLRYNLNLMSLNPTSKIKLICKLAAPLIKAHSDKRKQPGMTQTAQYSLHGCLVQSELSLVRPPFHTRFNISRIQTREDQACVLVLSAFNPLPTGAYFHATSHFPPEAANFPRTMLPNTCPHPLFGIITPLSLIFTIY